MLEQLTDQSKEEKIQKLEEFVDDLRQELKSAEEFKRDNPDREDMNALIELTLAIEEEAKAVNDLVKIGEDCPEDWADLEEARGSLTRTLARIRHKNWIALGPSSSRRINQLFFYVKKEPQSKEAAILLEELKEVSGQMLGEGLNPGLHSRLEKLSSLLHTSPGKKFYSKLLGQVRGLEESMDLSLFDGPVGGEKKCAVCSGELATGVSRCPNCGAAVLSLEQTRVVEGKQDAARSQLLDSLNHSWKLFEYEEIDQENFLRILKNLSERISKVVESLDSPTAVLLDFNTRLELYTQLPDRASLQTHWPSLLASGRALVNERLNKLERD
jgi:hypothetical protein